MLDIAYLILAVALPLLLLRSMATKTFGWLSAGWAILNMGDILRLSLIAEENASYIPHTAAEIAQTLGFSVLFLAAVILSVVFFPSASEGTNS